MLKKHVNRRSFLKGVAAVGLGTVGAQLLAACVPAPAAPAAQAPSTTNAGKAPAATDVTLRVQAAPEGGQAVMPAKLGKKIRDGYGR